MIVTTTQLRANQSYYLSMASREEIVVTKNGKVVAKITGAMSENVKSVSSLFGILPPDVDEDSLLRERALNS